MQSNQTNFHYGHTFHSVFRAGASKYPPQKSVFHAFSFFLFHLGMLWAKKNDKIDLGDFSFVYLHPMATLLSLLKTPKVLYESCLCFFPSFFIAVSFQTFGPFYGQRRIRTGDFEERKRKVPPMLHDADVQLQVQRRWKRRRSRRRR